MFLQELLSPSSPSSSEVYFARGSHGVYDSHHRSKLRARVMARTSRFVNLGVHQMVKIGDIHSTTIPAPPGMQKKRTTPLRCAKRTARRGARTHSLKIRSLARYHCASRAGYTKSEKSQYLILRFSGFRTLTYHPRPQTHVVYLIG